VRYSILILPALILFTTFAYSAPIDDVFTMLQTQNTQLGEYVNASEKTRQEFLSLELRIMENNAIFEKNIMTVSALIIIPILLFQAWAYRKQDKVINGYFMDIKLALDIDDKKIFEKRRAKLAR